MSTDKPYSMRGRDYRSRTRSLVAWALACALTLGPVLAVVAQEQKELPPAHPFLLPDSVARPQERPQLALPEVLVYGRDTSVRLPGQKLAVQNQPEASLPLRKAWAVFAETAAAPTGEEHFPDGRPSPHWLLVRLEGGSYWTANGEALFRHSGRRLNYGAEMSFRRSDGATDNGQYAIFALGGQVAYPMSGRGTVEGHLTLTQSNYGLAGATLPDTARFLRAERHAMATNVGARAEVGVGRGGLLTICYDYCSLRSSDDTLAARCSRLADDQHRVETTTALRVGRSDLLGRISYLREGYRSDDAKHRWTSLVQAECGIAGDVLRHGRLYLALGLHGFSSPAQGWTSTLAATARLWVASSPNLGWTLELRRAYDYRALGDRAAENPYYAPDVQLQPVRTNFACTIGAEWQLAPDLVLTARVGRAWLRDQWYWQREPDTGLFTTGLVPNVKLNYGTLALHYVPSDRLDVEARCLLWGDSFRLEQWPRAADVPYLARRRLPVTVTYRLGSRTRIELSADAISSRSAQIGSQEKLAPYGLLGCVITHQLGKRFVTFVRGENLTNTKYERWQGYREMGLTILAGGFATW